MNDEFDSQKIFAEVIVPMQEAQALLNDVQKVYDRLGDEMYLIGDLFSRPRKLRAIDKAELRDAAKKLSATVEYSNTSLLRVEREIQLAKKKKDLIPRAMAYENIISSAPSIIARNIEEAVDINREFRHPYYLDRLMESLTRVNSSTIRATMGGTAIEVNIRPERFAGRLEDWAAAIKQTRQDMKISIYREAKKKKDGTPKKVSPAALSYYWKNMIYLPANSEAGSGEEGDTSEGGYESTMISRLSHIPASLYGQAPFWELLDKGSLPMSSNIGEGSFPYPVNIPTGFIQQAEWDIVERHATLLAETIELNDANFEEWESHYRETRQVVDDVESYVDNIEDTIEYISGYIDDITAVLRATKGSIETARHILKVQLGGRAEMVGGDSEDEFLFRVLTGQYKIAGGLAQEKITIAKGVRIRYKRIMQALDNAIDDYRRATREYGRSTNSLELLVGLYRDVQREDGAAMYSDEIDFDTDDAGW